jgi:hypothetical protein
MEYQLVHSMVGRKAWSLVEQKVLATPLVIQKEPRSDFQMARSTDSTRAWKKETPTVPPTDSNLASTYCSVVNLAIHSVLQLAQYSDRTTGCCSGARRVAQLVEDLDPLLGWQKPWEVPSPHSLAMRMEKPRANYSERRSERCLGPEKAQNSAQ